MAIYEDYSPLYVGDTGKPFAVLFTELDPATGKPRAVNLAGIMITMVMTDLETDESRDCAGPWTVDSEAGGTAHYAWQEEDVAAPGVFDVQMTLWDEGGRPVHTDTKRIEIELPLRGRAARRFLRAGAALGAE